MELTKPLMRLEAKRDLFYMDINKRLARWVMEVSFLGKHGI